MPAEQVAVYRTVGGVALRAHMFFPAHQMSNAARPAVMIIHGGGWGGGTPDLFFPHARALAARGLVAVAISYRLTSQPGVTPHDCVRDAKAAVRWLRRNAGRHGIDPRRIAVAGDSAGGHLAAALGVLPGLEHDGEDLSVSSVPDALVLWNPITDTMPGGWDVKPPRGMVLTPVELDSWRRSLSPLHHVRPGLPPMQILHGTADTVVPLAQSEKFAAAVRAAGNRCDLRALDGRQHAFVIPGYGDAATFELAMAAMIGFLASVGIK
jgi:acetyl esterase/lipase